MFDTLVPLVSGSIKCLTASDSAADTLEEGSLSKAQLKSRRLIILPLNSRVSTRTDGAFE